MNERIYELYKSMDRQVLTADRRYIGQPSDIEKFAELIVRECAELATKEYNNYGGIHGNDLLEYFGVEE